MMKNLIVFYDEQKRFTTQLEDIPVPKTLQPHEVLIKVQVAGSNPKDYKHPLPEYFNIKVNQGDDCAGTVAAVGSAVKSFKEGERVAGFHMMDTENGTYAEYAVCPEQTVFRIPDGLSFEEAATFPLAIYTASVGLYRNLGVPEPWGRSDDGAAEKGKVGLLVNGGSSAVGAFAIKLAKLNPRISPIIATAGASSEFVKSLGVDAVVDYRSKTLADDIKKAAAGTSIKYVFDSNNTVQSVKVAAEILPKDGRYTCTTPLGAVEWMGRDGTMGKTLDAAGLWYQMIWVGDVHEQEQFGTKAVRAGGKLFGGVMSRTIETALANGKLKGHPYQVVEGGLNGIKEALLELKDRKKGGNSKYVIRISETDDAAKTGASF